MPVIEVFFPSRDLWGAHIENKLYARAVVPSAGGVQGQGAESSFVRLTVLLTDATLRSVQELGLEGLG